MKVQTLEKYATIILIIMPMYRYILILVLIFVHANVCSIRVAKNHLARIMKECEITEICIDNDSIFISIVTGYYNLHTVTVSVKLDATLMDTHDHCTNKYITQIVELMINNNIHKIK